MLNGLAFVFFCVFSVGAAGQTRAGELNHSSTPVRVLLERSRVALPLQITRPAAVRVNGVLRAPRLLPGTVWIRTDEAGAIELTRIPYLPMIAEDLMMTWPAGEPGFELQGRQYRGGLRLRPRAGDLFFINTVSMEDYLASTVGGEMSPSWPLEALKAQTVAARSYTVAKLRKPRDSFFDLEDTTEDQVYRGVETETLSIWDAVKQTDALVLTRSGNPVTAYYHSRCGGETLSADQVWGGRKFFTAQIPCTYCRKYPYQWDARWDNKGFAKRLGMPASRNIAVVPVSRNPAGRVLEVAVEAGGERRVLSAENLRRELGYTQLKSTHFEFHQDQDSIRATGLGAGHGVGMCQWGAKHLAQRGFSFTRILTHYYPREKTLRWAPPQKSVDSSRIAGVWSAHDRFSAVRFPATRRANRPLSSRTP